MRRYITALVLAVAIQNYGIAQQNDVSTTENYYTQNDTVKNKKGEILEEVIVTSNQQKTVSNIGKSTIKPMDLPQAIAVINNNTIVNQQVNSMTDLLKNTNGVYIMGTTGGYQEEIASRGFSLSSSNTFKNGIRYFNGMPTELSGIEKAEFLKGSAAILFGNVSAGGVLNLVTKKPKFERGAEGSMRYGSFNFMKPSFDIYGRFDESKTVAFRINGSFEQAESFRDFVTSKRQYLNPSFVIKFSDRTELLIEGDYLKDRRTPDFGAGIIKYQVVDIPRNRFLGVTWGYFDSEQLSGTATLSHKINNNWNVSFINGIRYYKTDLFTNTRPNNGIAITDNGNWTRNIQRAEVKDNYYIQQLDLKGEFKTWKFKHQFLVGADTETFKTVTTAYTTVNNYDVINIFKDYDPSIETVKPIPSPLRNAVTDAPVKRVGGYVQDLISFTQKWKLLAGVRYTYQDTRSDRTNYTAKGEVRPQVAADVTANYDSAFSPRLGLIYQPTLNHTVFATYSNSFDVNAGVDELRNSLTPSIINQYEVGVKNKIFGERLFLNVTTYQITNDKYYQASLVDATVKVLAGTIRSQGVELDIVSNPLKGLSILAGYSFNETKFTDSDYYIPGSFLRYNPKNTANLNANFTFESGMLKGLNLGLINTYFGERYAGRSTRIQMANDTRQLIYLKDYIQVDATLSYTFSKFALKTKLSNVFNELNYNVHDDNSVNPIAPRNYSISLNYIF